MLERETAEIRICLRSTQIVLAVLKFVYIGLNPVLNIGIFQSFGNEREHCAVDTR
jgi:hypothetical protein